MVLVLSHVLMAVFKSYSNDMSKHSQSDTAENNATVTAFVVKISIALKLMIT